MEILENLSDTEYVKIPSRVMDPMLYLPFQVSWKEAEELYPTCSVMWDIDSHRLFIDTYILINIRSLGILAAGKGNSSYSEWTYWLLKERRWGPRNVPMYP